MRALILVTLAVLAAGAAGGTPGEIQPDTLLGHIRFLSSDEMKGRSNGGAELDRAADYIAGQFKDAGLEPGGADGAWFQPFELVAGLTVGQGNALSITQQGTASRSTGGAGAIRAETARADTPRPDTTVRLSLGASYYPLAAPSNDVAASAAFVNLPLVFAGHGLALASEGYDDYARIDVSGKAVLVFSHEPQEQDASSRLNGTRSVPESTLQAKAALARSKGARLLLVISDPSHRADQADYKLFAADPDAEDHGIPVLRVRREEMQPLVDTWGLDALARLIDASLVPRSKELQGASVSYAEHLTKNRRMVRNVIGVLRGSDPARTGEAIVVGAHYDHVGLGGRLSVTPERVGEIHNGADDNASGTASVIEIARASVAQRARFPRTIVFVTFAGEERGLLGSSFYTLHPTVPMAKTIAMLNLDMVGRSLGGIDISGLEVSPSMEADLKAAAAAIRPLDIRRQGPGAGRSDDSSFSARQVPAINFFTGFHGDYHRPSDDWDRIDAPGTQQIATLALELAARLAARPQRPEFVSR